MFKYIAIALGSAAMLAVGGLTASATNGPPPKIVICHVAGSADDPANYITLELPYQAVYGIGGHFNEDGTTQAGHEQDTLGACNPPPPDDDPPTVTPTPTPTPTTPTSTPTPTPPVDRCPPGMVPTNGKDGEPGNDECEYPQTPTTPTVTTNPEPPGTNPTTTTTTTPVTTTPAGSPTPVPTTGTEQPSVTGVKEKNTPVTKKVTPKTHPKLPPSATKHNCPAGEAWAKGYGCSGVVMGDG